MSTHKQKRPRIISRTSPYNDQTVRASNIEALTSAINAQRTRLFRAEAIAACLARLLHEMYVPEKDEPDLAYVVDALHDEITDVVPNSTPRTWASE